MHAQLGAMLAGTGQLQRQQAGIDLLQRSTADDGQRAANQPLRPLDQADQRRLDVDELRPRDDLRQRAVKIEEQGLAPRQQRWRSEEHTSGLQSLMRISYAVFCLKKKKRTRREQTAYKKRESEEMITT